MRCHEGSGIHTLEFLLDFNGRIHHLDGGYWLKFEIRRTESTPERPHGLSYSLTRHAPDGIRLVGFDNTHAVRPTSTRTTNPRSQYDRWHRTTDDPGPPYRFVDAEPLACDFFDEVERLLAQRRVVLKTIHVEHKQS